MIYDYIVIGSGFGGSVASLRLVEKGHKVLTLEQGKLSNPSFTINAVAEYAMSKIKAKDGTQMTDLSKQFIFLEKEWKRKGYN